MGIISEIIIKTLGFEIDDYEMFISVNFQCLQKLIDELNLNKEQIKPINRYYAESLSKLSSLAIKYKTGIFFRF